MPHDLEVSGMSVVWVGDGLIDANKACISVFDHGFLTGDGVFESLAVHKGKPFALDSHLARLVRSAEGIGLEPIDVDLVRQALMAVVEANQLSEAAVRITVTAGEGPLSSPRGVSKPLVIVAHTQLLIPKDASRVAIAPWPRNERGVLAGLKTTSYAENVVSSAWARQRGADEAVFLNTAGNLCEGTGSNIFVVIGGEILTPPLSSGCLAGVIRDLVISRHPVRQEDIPGSILQTTGGELEEAFLTSSLRYVQPISSIDGWEVPRCPGEVTERIRKDIISLIPQD